MQHALVKMKQIEHFVQVRFDDVIDIIPPCTQWSEEDYQDARKSQWQQHYLDRIRFKNRIDEINSNIGYIFIKRYEDYKSNNIPNSV